MIRKGKAEQEGHMEQRIAERFRRLGSILKRNSLEIAVVLLCTAVLGAGVSRKQGYHMDELLSFELSNAEFNPWIVPTQPEGRLAKFVRNEIKGASLGETLGNIKDTVLDVFHNRGSSKLLSYKADVYKEPVWIDRETFQNYITVGEDDAFNYLSVYFNVKDDNHPPFHFMLLHTMCSVFRGSAAPFVGCVINLAASAGILILLINTGKRLAVSLHMEEYGRILGVTAALLYGLSTGAMAAALLIRMYAVLTFFCMAFFALHVKKWQEDGWEGRNKVLILVTVLGFLTQYFFLFYCLLLAAVTAIILVVHKKYKAFLVYVRSMIIAAVIGIVLFPFAISDVFSSGRGVEALQNLAEGAAGYGTRIAAFFSILSERTLHGGLLPAAAVLGAVLLILTCRRKQGGLKYVIKSRTDEAARGILWMLLLPPLGYFLLAARMSPYLVDRYIMPLFPFAALIAAVLILWLVSRLEKGSGEESIKYVVCGILVLWQLVGLFQYDGEYLYTGYSVQENVAREYDEYPCICVYEGVGYYENLLEFTSYEKTLLLKAEELAAREDVESIASLDAAVVMVKQGVDWNETVEIMAENYGLYFQEWLIRESVHGDTIGLFVSRPDMNKL